MTTYRLDAIFAPRSIAVVGASPRPHSVGRAILRNLRGAGFDGPVRLVNRTHRAIDGVVAVGNVDDLPPTDLLVVAVPPADIPTLIANAGGRGCAAAIIVTSGLGEGRGSIAEAAQRAARAEGVRLLGPNCLGVQVPRLKLNASFAAELSAPGHIALISQSGAIMAGLVAWANRRGVGLSGAVSLGNQIDVDFGDLLDYFAVDKATGSIVLYVESVIEARKFMSAARAAARSKPVMVIKGGRHVQAAAAVRTHTGALAGADAVYDAAFRRAGLLRVMDLEEMFDAVETLSHLRPFSGDRLAILTNGGGVGVLAVDRVLDLGGNLAALSPETIQSLNQRLPPIWSGANPVDIAGDADAERYAVALDALLADPANDAILVMNVPTALASATEAATVVATRVRAEQARRFPPKPVFGVWLGDDGEAASTLEQSGIPHFATESDAARGFMHLVRYRQTRDALMATPPSLPTAFVPDVVAARGIVAGALAEQRAWLDPLEVSAVLKAYGIPAPPVVFAPNADEAERLAAPMLATGAIAVKILSPEITHKSDMGGVRLGLTHARAVRAATETMLAHVRARAPKARLIGVTLHPMVERRHGRELLAGIAQDPTFGPVVVFGAGGVAVEAIADSALALPPLDLGLARDLIGRTRIARLLHGYRDVPQVDVDAVALTLIKLAQLSADIPELQDIDLNPLVADGTGVIVLDARMAIRPEAGACEPIGDHPRFAVRPYPTEWECGATLSDGAGILIRPVRPDDERLYPPFLQKTNANDLRLRFFGAIKEFDHAAIARFTQIDYARAMAFVAIDKATGEMLGVSRLHTFSDRRSGEFAILIRTDAHRRGLGWLLMQRLIAFARAERIGTIEGEVLAENVTMLKMCRKLGFAVREDHKEAGLCHVALNVVPKEAGAAPTG
jgi:acetyltransferase